MTSDTSVQRSTPVRAVDEARLTALAEPEVRIHFPPAASPVRTFAAKRNRVLRKAVEPHFLGPPIEGATAVFDELLEIPDIRSVGPRFPRRLVGETRSPEPVVEVGDGLFREL